MSLTAPILYLGDTALDAAACYLAGVLSYCGFEFDYTDSTTDVTAEDLKGRSLIIISDYPSARFGKNGLTTLCDMIAGGCGLLCLGGWESYQGWFGREGGYASTPLADILPVQLSDQDDRVNFDQAAVVHLADRTQIHTILQDLPWDDRPPVIGGYNQFTPKQGADVLLNVTRFGIRHDASAKASGTHIVNNYALEPVATDPMLVTRTHGEGRIACLATDAAPHWIGPMVDWGTDNTRPSRAGRILVQPKRSETIEVGRYYVQFFHQLLSWCTPSLSSLQQDLQKP